MRAERDLVYLSVGRPICTSGEELPGQDACESVLGAELHEDNKIITLSSAPQTVSAGTRQRKEVQVGEFPVPKDVL